MPALRLHTHILERLPAPKKRPRAPQKMPGLQTQIYHQKLFAQQAEEGAHD